MVALFRDTGQKQNWKMKTREMGELKGLKKPWRHMKRNKDIDESQAEGRHEGKHLG